MNACYISAFASPSDLPNSIPMSLHPKGFTGKLPQLCQILKGEHREQIIVISFYFLLLLDGETKKKVFLLNTLNVGFPVCFVWTANSESWCWVFMALLDSQEPDIVLNYHVHVSFQPNLVFSLHQNVGGRLSNVWHWKLGIFNSICVQGLRWKVLHPALGPPVEE